MARMIIRLLFSTVAALAVTAAFPAGAQAPATSAAPPPSTVTLPPPETWGPFGIQLDKMDTSVRPGDDFDRYVNGKWEDQAQIPPDRTNTGSFIQLDDLSEARMHAILEELASTPQAPGSDGARVAAAYEAFMNTQAIERAGMAPAQPTLDRIFSARNTSDLVALFASPSLASPISLGVDVDEKDSNNYALYAGQAALGLPDRDYYLVDSPANRAITAKYIAYLQFLLAQAGYKDPVGAANAVYGLEKKMAAANWDRGLGRDKDLTYHKLTVDQFAALAPEVPLKAMLGQLGAARFDSIVVRELPPTPEQLAAAKYTPEMAAKLGGGVPALAHLIASEPVATWQAWLITRFLADKASVLPRRIDDATFAFYGTVLSGQPQQRPRWKRAVDAVEGEVGELAGKIYAARYFPPESKAHMDQLVANLRAALGNSLASIKWMSPATKKEAYAKLASFNPKIGYPDKFKTYDGLVPQPDAALANSLAADRWNLDYDLHRLGRPVDRSEWFMFPQTVNAYYLASGNEVVFPAAILQPPFFNIAADDAVNYGGIGAVIGHEMGHGFDDQGSKSDATGNLRNWWTPQDRAAFDKLTAALVDEYDHFCPFDAGKTCVNGRLTLGENIGDLGGLSLAYRAYHMSLGGKPAPVIDGFTGDQRFFMAWAQVWRAKIREEAARQRLLTDPHSPPKYRINGIVPNFNEWYKAFGVKPGDKLYLPPAKRVRIW